MQRLIGDAQQRAVRYAETVALRGDGGAFHIDGYRPAEVKAQRRGGITQFPVAIIGGHHRTGTQTLFDLFPRHAANLFSGVIQRALHFGDTRDGNIRRQHRIQYVVVT